MTPPQKMPPATGVEFHWKSIVRILWKGKITVVAIWLALSVLTVAVVLRLPAIYQAECLLLVVGQKIPDKYVASTVTTDPQERLASISHLVLSNTQLQNIIDTYGLYEEERKTLTRDQIIRRMREKDITLKLESALSASARPDAFRVSFQAKDARMAADVANRLATLIIDENKRTREGRAEETSEFIGEQQKQAKATLDKLEERVSLYKSSHGGELPEQQSTLAATLSRLQTELQGTQEALNRAEQNKAMQQNTLVIAEGSLATLERTAKENREREETNRRIRASAPDAPTAKPKTRRQTLTEELASLRSRYGEEHPEIRRVKAEIAVLPADPDDDGTKVAKGAGQEIVLPATGPSEAIVSERERVASLRMQIGLAAKDFEAANANRMRVLRDIDVYQGRVNRLPLREQEMAALTRDYEMAKENYKSLLTNQTAAKLSTALERSEQGERFSLIDGARVPEEPIKPARPQLYAGGVFLSLMLSALYVVGRRLPKDTMLGEWELTPGIVVLGRVPLIEMHKGKLALAPEGPSA